MTKLMPLLQKRLLQGNSEMTQKKVLPIIPVSFVPRPSTFRIHRANATVLMRFGDADQKFAGANLTSSSGKAFESEDDALNEEIHRIKTLYNGCKFPTARELQHAFEKDVIWASFASARFTYHFRMRLMKRLLKLLKSFAAEDSKRLNIVSPCWWLTPAELNVQAHANVKKKMRRILDDAGMTALHGLVFGQLDLEFDGEYYWPHFHLMVAGAKIDAIDALRKIMLTHVSDNCKHPLVVEDVNKVGGAASYCVKQYCKMKIRAKDKGYSESKRVPKAQRLPSHLEAEWLTVMHRVRVSDVLLLQGMRLGRHGLNIFKWGAEL